VPRGARRAKVIKLDAYRKATREQTATLEIKLLADGRIMYDVPDLKTAQAFMALLGCYAVAGELLDTLRGDVLCTNEHC
jgi:hypothetical protein